MHYFKYLVYYAKTGEQFTKDFTTDQYEDLNFVMPSVPEIEALRLVNKWNRQNATSGFTYWLE